MYKILFVFLLALFLPTAADAQIPSAVNLTGYAWSSNIGWVSFNGPGYGVRIETSGNLSGYAWSSNIGWISFQVSSGCPGGTCQARLDISANELLGWARACSATVNGDCTGGQNTNAGSWDGWISLNCANRGSCASNSFAVSTVSSAFSNYAWGGDVIGYIRMNVSPGVIFTPPCAAANTCSADLANRISTNQWCVATLNPCASGYQCNVSSPTTCNPSPVIANLRAAPRVVRPDATTRLTWSTTNATACDLRQSNPAGTVASSWTGISGTNVTSASITSLTVFRLSCSDVTGGNYREVASTTVNLTPQIIEI